MYESRVGLVCGKGEDACGAVRRHRQGRKRIQAGQKVGQFGGEACDARGEKSVGFSARLPIKECIQFAFGEIRGRSRKPSLPRKARKLFRLPGYARLRSLEAENEFRLPSVFVGGKDESSGEAGVVQAQADARRRGEIGGFPDERAARFR